ncbi:MAG: DoxX family membrane protein [candidate division Zixibacteria bacterium]|nr:DoxX family membrane protein [candidate division Zixibacteria bacterium]
MAFLKNDWVLLGIRLIVGGFFVYAALDKIGNPGEFSRIVYNYRVLPGSLVNAFAIFLPWLELFAGMALIIGTRTVGSAAVITGLMAVFIIAVTSAVARGIKIDCGCFTTGGNGARQVGLPLIIQDAVLLVLSLWIWIQGAGRWALDATSRTRKVASREEVLSASEA